MSDLNQQLIEQLLQRIDLLEKEIKKHKKSKMAKKDYDKDGKVESSEDEYLGSRDRAIKKAQGKIEEALDRIGGNVNTNSPSIRSLASKIEKSDLIEKVINKLEERNPMNKKSFKDQGTKVQLSENLVFGGFPRTKLNEGEESESLSPTPQYAPAPPFDPYNRVFYPSQEFADLHGMYMKAIQAHNADPSEQNKQEVRRLFAVMRAHPHFEEHQENIRELERSRLERGRSQSERSSPKPGFEDPRLGIQGRSSIN